MDKWIYNGSRSLPPSRSSSTTSRRSPQQSLQNAARTRAGSRSPSWLRPKLPPLYNKVGGRRAAAVYLRQVGAVEYLRPRSVITCKNWCQRGILAVACWPYLSQS